VLAPPAVVEGRAPVELRRTPIATVMSIEVLVTTVLQRAWTGAAAG
jgi:hypothetical protein